MRILILCTGNSCRSQMAHGFLQSFDAKLEVFSAGTAPVNQVNPLAVKVMAEVGIDISQHVPINVNKYITQKWDYVFTVCSDAEKSCPHFKGNVKTQIHIPFEDPSDAVGTTAFRSNEFQTTRDKIKNYFFKFYNDNN